MRSSFESTIDVEGHLVEQHEAALDRLVGDGVRPLRLEEAIFEAMLDG